LENISAVFRPINEVFAFFHGLLSGVSYLLEEYCVYDMWVALKLLASLLN